MKIGDTVTNIEPFSVPNLMSFPENIELPAGTEFVILDVYANIFSEPELQMDLVIQLRTDAYDGGVIRLRPSFFEEKFGIDFPV